MKCVVKKIVFQNEENGWAVAACEEDGKEVTLVGVMPGIRKEMELSATGEWKTNSKYGNQFSVTSWVELLPETVQGMREYLKSGVVTGIGPAYADRIINSFGSDTFKVLDCNPRLLLRVRGIGEKKLEMIQRSWEKQSAFRSIMMFFQHYGIGFSNIGKIYRAYGEDSIDIIRKNPYRLADEVSGIGFKTADEIARSLGVKTDDPDRLRSGIRYTLNIFSQGGHCYAQGAVLAERSAEILGVNISVVRQVMQELVAQKKLVMEGGRYYLPESYQAEINVAKNIARIKNAPGIRCPEAFKKGFYDAVQEQAIQMALSQKICYITGGPGTGKTTITNEIIKRFREAGLQVILAAPTGRAAKRMSEVSGREATTIHRLLESNGKVFLRNEKYRIQGDVLILDECSMMDLALTDALLKAVPDRMRVVFVGDADQLPSVGAGNVLNDIILSQTIPGVRLTHIYRQEKGSLIADNAARINGRLMPDLSNKSDFFFIRGRDDEATADKIVRCCTENLPKYYKVSPLDIQVLSPVKKGPCGTRELNRKLQGALNPHGRVMTGTGFRAGDKVMQMKNDYDKEVYNGDIGFVQDVTPYFLSVAFEDREIVYERSDLDELSLAYATTVHKAQGSEYGIVVMTFMSNMMLNKKLLYTGITRAKNTFVMFGEEQAIQTAINRKVERNTTLATRLREGLVQWRDGCQEPPQTHRTEKPGLG